MPVSGPRHRPGRDALPPRIRPEDIAAAQQLPDHVIIRVLGSEAPRQVEFSLSARRRLTGASVRVQRAERPAERRNADVRIVARAFSP